ncbi:MAG: FAD-dependent oxidoreductase [Sphingomonadaceae bacterium]
MFVRASIAGGRVVEPQRELPVVADVDVVVAGGGPASLGAAVAAARCGARTLLIERNGFLGGAATAGLMAMWNASLDTSTGFAHELIARLIREGGALSGPATPFDPEKLKEVALDIVLEAGVQPLFYTNCAAPILDGRRVAGVVLESKSGRQAALAKVVVDCTGDADIAAAAGVPCVKGRERDGKMRPVSVIFRMGGIDVREMVEFARAHPEDFTADPTFQLLDIDRGLVRVFGFFREVEDARMRGELDPECHYLRFEGVDVARGTAFVNSTRVYGVDGTQAGDLTRAEIEARRQMRQLVSFIKTLPGCENAYVLETSASIGVRETRRIRGEAVLTEEDIAAGKTYEDTVARLFRRGEIGIETHSPDGGEGAAGDVAWRKIHWPLTSYELPYGSLVPLEIDGLLVGGRCISQTHEADKYTRSMHCCMVIGQAAGAAASLAAAAGVQPRALDRLALQRTLLSQGVDLGQQTERVRSSLS